MDNILNGTSFLVTGATGFVGSAFVRHAIKQGANVTAVARKNSDHWRLAPVSGRYTTLEASLRELSETRPLSLPIGAVVHFAAAGVNQSFDDVGELVETNVVGTLHTLDFALRSGVRRFVLIGSSAEYGPGERLSENNPLRPTSEYGATQASATLLAKAFGKRRGIEIVVIRPFSVYGPYEAPYRLIPYAILRGLSGLPIQISSGVQTRDYVYLDDVIEGIARASVLADAAGEVFNLCSGVDTSVLDAATLVSQTTGCRSEVDAGVVPTIPGEMWRTSGDPDKAQMLLGWSPKWTFAEGLAETVCWFREEGAELTQYS